MFIIRVSPKVGKVVCLAVAEPRLELIDEDRFRVAGRLFAWSDVREVGLAARGGASQVTHTNSAPSARR